MAVAVGAATVAIAYMATLELQLTERLSPFDRKLFLGLAVALAGVGLMALAAWQTRGPVRFASRDLALGAGQLVRGPPRPGPRRPRGARRPRPKASPGLNNLVACGGRASLPAGSGRTTLSMGGSRP